MSEQGVSLRSQGWFIVLMLILFFPVGLVLMWIQDPKSPILGNSGVRVVITGLFVIVLASAAMAPKPDPATAAPTQQEQAQPQAKAAAPAPKAAVKATGSTFDIKKTVAKMESPYAAMKSNPKFKRSDLNDGTERWLAKDDTLLFEVTPTYLTLVFGIDEGNSQHVVNGMLSCGRICNAVYGENDKKAVEKAMELIGVVAKAGKKKEITYGGHKISCDPFMPNMYLFKVSK